MATKITKKENHDSLWVKCDFGDKEYIKLVINRRGVRLDSTLPEVVCQAHIDAFNAVFKAYKKEGWNYGKLIQETEAAWQKLN